MGPSVSISKDLLKKQELRREQKDMRYRSADTHIKTQLKQSWKTQVQKGLPIDSERYLKEVPRKANLDCDPRRPPTDLKDQTDSYNRMDFIESTPTGPSLVKQLEDNPFQQRQIAPKPLLKKRIHTRQKPKNFLQKGNSQPYQIQGRYMEEVRLGEDKVQKQDESAKQSLTPLKPANSNIELYGEYAEQQKKEKLSKQKYLDQNGPVLEEYWPEQKRELSPKIVKLVKRVQNLPQKLNEGLGFCSGNLRQNGLQGRNLKRQMSEKGIEVLSPNWREKEENLKKNRVALRR